MKHRSPNEAERLKEYFGRIYDDIYTFVKVKLTAKMFILEALYIRQCLDVLEGLLSDCGNSISQRQLQRLFLFSLMWSLGAVLEHEDRFKLEEFVLQHKSKMRKLVSSRFCPSLNDNFLLHSLAKIGYW